MKKPKFKVGDRIQFTEEAKKQSWCRWKDTSLDIRVTRIIEYRKEPSYYFSYNGVDSMGHSQEKYFEPYGSSREDQCIGL